MQCFFFLGILYLNLPFSVLVIPRYSQSHFVSKRREYYVILTELSFKLSYVALRCVALCCVFFRTRSFAAFRSSRLVFGFGTTIIWKKIYKNKYNNGMSTCRESLIVKV